MGKGLVILLMPFSFLSHARTGWFGSDSKRHCLLEP